MYDIVLFQKEGRRADGAIYRWEFLEFGENIAWLYQCFSEGAGWTNDNAQFSKAEFSEFLSRFLKDKKAEFVGQRGEICFWTDGDKIWFKVKGVNGIEVVLKVVFCISRLFYILNLGDEFGRFLLANNIWCRE